MATNNIRVERPPQTIKSNVTPISAATKVKISEAFQEIVNKVKAKHLS
jgi:hypothetical protein